MRKKIEEKIEQDAKTTTNPAENSASLPRTQSQNMQSGALYAQIRQNFAYMMQNPYAKSIVKIGGTSFGVATALYPLEVLRDRAQLNMQSSINLKDIFKIKFKDINFNTLKSSFKFPVMFNYKSLMPFLQGYLNANRMSLGKNTVISQRDPVSQHVESFIGEKGKESTDSVGNRRFDSNKYKVTTLSALIISSLDLTFTQYYSNMRVFNMMGKVIELGSVKQKFDFMQVGATLRLIRNFGGAFACIATNSILKEPIDRHLISHDTSPYAHNAATSIIASTLIAPGVNTLEYLYRNQLKAMDPQTFKAPSGWQVLKETVKTSGFKAPLKGLKWTVVTNALAFYAINGISDFLDTHVFTDAKAEKPRVPQQPQVHKETKPAEQQRVSQSPSTLFASKGPRKPTEVVNSQNSETVEQPSTTTPPRV